ncbi:MAG: efflux RND transporter permease subunit, partial [Lentisphaeria bacterium]
LPFVVIGSFIISWIESLYILPSHLAHVSAKPRTGLNKFIHTIQQKFSHGFMHIVHTKYGPFIDRVLHWRYIIAIAAMGIFVCAIMVIKMGYLGFEMFPRSESDYSFASVELPYGVPVAQTVEVSKILNQYARQAAIELDNPEIIDGIFADVGRGGSHAMEIRVYLKDADYRNKVNISTEKFTNQWKKICANLPGLKTLEFMSDRGGPGSGAALTIELRHNNTKVLEQMAEDLANKLENYDRISQINSGFQLGKTQIDFKIKPEGEQLGITANYLGRKLRGFYEGSEVVRQQRGRNEIKVKVRLPEEERKNFFQLEEMIIATPFGGEVALKDIAEIHIGRAYTHISRRNGLRTMSVTADVNPRSRAGEVMAVLDKETLPELMANYPGASYSYQGMQADSRESMQTFMIAIPIVLLAIYALLAIPFRSYTQPLIVMVSIPLGIVGAIIGHLIMGYNLSMIGCIGILALSGVVVNDALVLIDFVNQSRKNGKNAHDAVILAGIQRFRPIMLTTMTTFCGLMPMIFETSRQARFLIPMAISLGFGIIFATLITLVLVPSLYMITDDYHRFIKWLNS